MLLQTVLRPALPPLKFFTKQQLLWLPLAGLAMKLLGFPYVRRGRPGIGDGGRADGAPGFWAFLGGRRRRVRMWVERHEITPAMQAPDAMAQRAALAPFIEDLWRSKDARLRAAALATTAD